MEKKDHYPSQDFSSQSVRMLALAPSQYGKSYQVSKWVISEIKKGDRGWSYERVVIFSPTARSDPSQLMIAKEAKKKNPKWLETNVFEAIDEEFIEYLYESQKKNQRKRQQSFRVGSDFR